MLLLIYRQYRMWTCENHCPEVGFPSVINTWWHRQADSCTLLNNDAESTTRSEELPYMKLCPLHASRRHSWETGAGAQLPYAWLKKMLKYSETFRLTHICSFEFKLKRSEEGKNQTQLGFMSWYNEWLMSHILLLSCWCVRGDRHHQQWAHTLPVFTCCIYILEH